MTELNIKAFIEEYTHSENKKEVLDKIEIENYIPVLLKKEVINAIIDSFINYENGMITYEPIDKHICFTLGFITLYTNLVYEDNGSESYDLLMKNDVVDYIIKSIGLDYGDFVALFEETLNNRIAFNNSIPNRFGALLGTLEETVKNIDINEIAKILGD